MKTSDLENDIKSRLRAAEKEREGNDIQLSCRINAACYQQLAVLSDMLNKTRNELAEHLLEQAVAIAWDAAGLGKEGAVDNKEIQASAHGREAEKEDKGKESMGTDKTGFSRIKCINAVFDHLGLEVGRARETMAIAVSQDNSTRICCLTSKDHDAEKGKADSEHYWFTIYENQLESIQTGKHSYVAFGCGSTEQIVVIPADEFSTWTDVLPPYTQGKTGWHIQLSKVSGKWELRREGRGKSPIDVTKFLM